MATVVSVGDVARQYGVSPHLVSNLFWQRHLNPDRCPVVAGRRLIPADYIDEIGRVLAGRGYLTASAGTTN